MAEVRDKAHYSIVKKGEGVEVRISVGGAYGDGRDYDFNVKIKPGDADRFVGLVTAFYGADFEKACIKAFDYDFNYPCFCDFCERNGIGYETFVW